MRLNSVNLGKVASLMYCIARVNREVNKVNRLKVHHMLHKQLEWVINHPPPQPCPQLSTPLYLSPYTGRTRL